ncbi:hypothetical protein FHX74_002789 [Friedmanniella endophytica]|uniref:Glycosyltransferase 2-like domain-containing protein n=1 Tax=Microlunatus kandeliicorticis TaxID=1759536 RepID=A0A7W3ITV4_9ACTN|nr:glycosyltransferase family 2 protein [Microlunatus kandeliicorticis]MBA8795161.1 hypothetical protein [Microlunatus kandeliicorticis]
MSAPDPRAPEISIIVPAKDLDHYLADCLTSLVRQLDDLSGPDALQVVVVDDGSTDRTADVAASFRNRLPGLEILRNATPVGLASARNQGLRAARGHYLGFLDGDDWLSPGQLSTLLRWIRRLDVDFVRTDHVRSTAGRRQQVRAPQAVRHVRLDPRASILPETATTMIDYCYAWAGLFDRRVLPLLSFPEGLFTAEDRPWCWGLHLRAASYAVVDSPGILYRRGSATSLTQIVDRRQLDFLPAFAQVFGLVRDDHEADRFWPKAARMFLGVLAHHLSRQHLMRLADATALHRRARPLVQQVPEAALAHAFAGLSEERRRLLRPVVGRAVGDEVDAGFWSGHSRVAAVRGRVVGSLAHQAVIE